MSNNKNLETRFCVHFIIHVMELSSKNSFNQNNKKKSFFMFFKLVNNVIPFYCKFSVSHIRVRLVLKFVSYTHQLKKDVPKYRELHYLLYK